MFTMLSNTPAAQQHFFISAKGATLNVSLYPKENAPTVILLHGGPGVPAPMDAAVTMLRKNFQVIFFQQRGTGASVCPSGSYAIEDYIADLDAVADYFHLAKFHLFGHSWGGLYAQIYAQERPEKLLSLFLSSPSSGTGAVWKETEKEVMQFNKKACTAWQWMVMGWRSLHGAMGSDKAYQQLFRQVLRNYNKGYDTAPEDDSWLNDIAADPVNKTRKSIIAYPPLRPMNCAFPVTIAYGEKDIYGPSRNHVMKRYPTARQVTIEKAGHLPWVHNPSHFEKILNDHFQANGRITGDL